MDPCWAQSSQRGGGWERGLPSEGPGLRLCWDLSCGFKSFWWLFLWREIRSWDFNKKGI